ncbi:metal ABC transporter solute-binding protein, Zn/Mn family [Nitratifractor salsuginis]|uniref:Periplasmic solute binding protein n=1 Tax=Nitratifractor salsuginis (strain DSM 16511 / JCM 12458 / E9I37-1) TaxID=749222 RepID=E6X1G0_NITSE|nr:zinc ABC transporter substrate-binding protein [Nitratifractor salsuginis]ADV45893.1 periplasmic solute binding protein [Nitratifractor salsuginis DSM 16511]
MRLLSLFLFTVLFLHAKLDIVVSIVPEKYFVRQIAGPYADITVMVPPGSSPHSYEPKPSQMRSISDADLYFAIGVEFEKAWLPRFLSQNPNLRVIDLSKAVQKIPMQSGHHHGKYEPTAHRHENEGLDPHIWLSVRNVEKMAPMIEKALESEDPGHASEYRKNLQAFEERLKALDRRIAAKLSHLPKRTAFMVVHPSWGYFARDYGLRQLPVQIEGKAPKPRQLMRLIDEAKRAKVRAIFVQPEFSDKSALVLAKELGIPVIKISPLSEDWEATLLKLAEAIAGPKAP